MDKRVSRGVGRGGGWPGLVYDVPLSEVWRRDLAEGGVYEALGAEGRIRPSGASELSGCVVTSRRPVALAAW